MATHTPNRSIQNRQYVVKIEAQPNSVQEKSLASTNLPRNVELGPVNDLESGLLGIFNVDDHSDVNSETPLPLPSTGTASTASSPGTIDDIWDSPLPSSHHLSPTCSDVTLTPLTPPSAHYVSPDSSPAPRAYKALPVKCVEEGGARDALATLNASHCAKTNLGIDPTQDEDYFFKPQKLIRNLTKELQAIANANAAAAQPCYNLRPDFNFGGATESKTSARPHRSIVVTRHDARSESKPQIEVKRTAEISDKNSLPRTQMASNLLHTTLEHIVPMTIQSRVMENHGKCVASKVGKPQERCSSKSPGLGIDIISRNLSRCNVEADPSGVLEHIERLVEAVMCGTHRNVARSSKRQEKLKNLATCFVKLSGAERTEFQAWLSAIAPRHLPTGVQPTTVHIPQKDTKSAASKTLETRDKPVAPSATKKNPAGDTWKQAHLPGFRAYQPKSTKDQSISTALHREIIKPLPPSSLKDGFIYVFWDKEHFGKVKIGRTNDLERRLKEWNRDCNRIHMYHPASQREELSKIPHVSRIERLIHIELKECRKQRYCPSCDKTHQEWFDVGEASVTKIFRKWQDWIMQRPYALDPITDTWVLRPEVMQTLDQVCEPVVLAEKPLPLRRAAAKGPKKPKRRSL
ncbi:DUF1766-domain-containing protein [Paraphaeosphaeria sporulosa]|uniref:DUF1766-domain-containing protein n=1 Tax=Paraphaeosphaeria sporulosa TaxID=1460663 RepID=A0A177CJN6_9PLEO|nr:DUF1766-domain-containing protein [Paraphaeosphaeria sporulosa]OAG07516.1 DUF1766-domain-containing protein [Paraphaeosphaeria sporulosa]